jgi:hypothetical protein
METALSARITASPISNGMPQETQLPLGAVFSAAPSAADISPDREPDADSAALPLKGSGLK